ncbi:MAG: hypothetical protein IGS03_01755 [Candidatus Sericytochromatia bacterium]|nr:hypothetical protein [Candidatus Sericytochromatia bacterium]
MSHEILLEEIADLKVLLDHEGYDYQDGAEEDVLDSVARTFRLPGVYRAFLGQLNPGDSVWRIGGQIAVQLHSADALPEFQADAEPGYFVIGSFNDQPLVLESASDDALSAAVFVLEPDGDARCIASSFPQFLKMVRTGLDMLSGLSAFDEDGEGSFDEAYDDVNDFEEGAFARDRDDVLGDYRDELEAIDPDCAEAWLPA